MPAAVGRIAGYADWSGHSVGGVADTQSGLVRRVQAGTVRLAYRTWGPAGAPPLVLLHALGEQSSDWAPVAQALASSWRVYAPDLRGHGASDWAGPYTIEQLATDLAAFLDALELEQVALGGHSIGAPPAYLYAARHPGRVTRLILEDPAPPWPRARRSPARPEGPLPFDWAATALSNDFTEPAGRLLVRLSCGGSRPRRFSSRAARPATSTRASSRSWPRSSRTASW